MNPIIAGTICLTIGMMWLFLRNNYKSRQYIESREHIELVLKSTGIGWFVPAFIVLNLLTYWFNHKNGPSKTGKYPRTFYSPDLSWQNWQTGGCKNRYGLTGYCLWKGKYCISVTESPG